MLTSAFNLPPHLAGIDAVQARHVDVEQHKIERFCFKNIEHLIAITCLGDLMAGCFQYCGQDVAVGAVIVRDKDIAARSFCRCRRFWDAGIIEVHPMRERTADPDGAAQFVKACIGGDDRCKCCAD